MYAAGFYNDGSKDIACYWRNGTKTDLHTTSNSQVNGIAISEGFVYAAGYYTDSGVTKACYWKIPLSGGTGERTSMTTSNSAATAIVVDGTNVYMSGYFDVDGDYTSCYWRNTTKTNLHDSSESFSYAIALSEAGNVLTAGSYVDSGIVKACYWRNTTKTDLYTTSNSQAKAIAFGEISGTPVMFVTGYYTDGNNKACYWRQSASYKFDQQQYGTIASAEANAITAVGMDVYTAGQYREAGGMYNKACYWKNTTTRTVLYTDAESNAKSIIVVTE